MFISTQLIRALCEWKTGNFTDLSSPNCQSVMHFDNVRSRILTKLVENELSKTDSWKLLQIIVSQDVDSSTEL